MGEPRCALRDGIVVWIEKWGSAVEHQPSQWSHGEAARRMCVFYVVYRPR